MSVSLNERTNLIKLAVAMFNVAPGATYLAEITGLYEANGRSLGNVAAILSNTPAYKALNPVFQTAGEFATAFLTPLGLQANSEARDYIVAKFNAYGTGTVNKGQISLDAAAALVNYTGADASLLAAKATLENKTTVATYYSVDKLIASTDLAALKAVLVGVTSDIATVDTAKVAIDGTAAAAVVTTFTLTTGVDTLVGSSGNDTFNATNVFLPGTSTSISTLSGLDTINGGGGVNTLNIIDGTGGVVDLTLPSSITNIQTLNLTSVGSVKGNAANTEINLKTLVTSGLTAANINVKEGNLLTVDAASTTALNVTNDSDVKVNGSGGALTVKAIGSSATIGDSTFTAGTPNAFTSVSVNVSTADDDIGGNVAIYDNSGTAGAVGSTLTTVSVQGINAPSSVTGDGVTTVNLTNNNDSFTINNTKAHALTLNVKAQQAGYNVVDSTATSVAITATAATATEFVGSGYTNSDFFGIFNKATTISVAGNDKLVLHDGGSLSKLTTVTYTGTGSLTTDLSGVANLKTVDASGATGAIKVTIAGTNTATTPAAQSVIGGSGNDIVTITGTLGKGSTLSLGAGSDTVKVTGAGVITSDAVVDGGDGVDTLLLSLVGSANVGAFKNFENFDVAGLAAGSFDTSILAANNTVTNFVGSAAEAGNVTLFKLAAGVGFIATGDMSSGGFATTLTQATGGALTVTLNSDEVKANGTANTNGLKLVASNATALTAVFDADYKDAQVAGTLANTTTIDLTGTKATALTVVSGGTEASNVLTYSAGPDAAATTKGLLATITATGSQALDVTGVVTTANGSGLTTIDASGMTGALTAATVVLKNGGVIKLGGGADSVLVGVTSSAVHATLAGDNVESITGFAKSLSTTESTAIALADKLTFDYKSTAAADVVAVIGTASTGTGYSVSNKGIVTFTGAGPANLDLAFGIASAAAGGTDGNAVAFEYVGSTYVFVEGGTDANAAANAASLTGDVVITLTGVTGVTSLNEVGSSNVLFIA